MANWIDTIFQFLPIGRYNSSPPTVASGSVAELQCDQNGRMLVNVAASVDPGQQFARTRYVGPVAGSSGALAVSGACKLLEIKAQNRSSNDRFLHIYDSTSAPSMGVTVPKLSYKLVAGEYGELNYRLRGHDFNNGVFWAVSAGASPYSSTTDQFFIEIVTEALS